MSELNELFKVLADGENNPVGKRLKKWHYRKYK